MKMMFDESLPVIKIDYCSSNCQYETNVGLKQEKDPCALYLKINKSQQLEKKKIYSFDILEKIYEVKTV